MLPLLNNKKNMAQKNNYIDATFDRKQNKVIVWERSEEGRITQLYEAPHYFYIKDPEGQYTSMYGDKLKKLVFRNGWEMSEEAKKYNEKFESDISPVDRILSKEYYQVQAPPIHVALFDIEVDYDPELGFSRPENPYAPVNAVTVFKKWADEYVCIAVPPSTWYEKFDDPYNVDNLLNEMDGPLDPRVTIHLVRDEAALLEMLLKEIEDADVLSGWNSEGYDMPYLVNRTEKVLGRGAMGQWCFPGAPEPSFKEFEKFGQKRLEVSIFGRIHLDYLLLFKKYAFGGRSSYSLDNIASEELDNFTKIHYEGTLAELYKNNFSMFVKYNVRDVEVLEQLDAKFKFIETANELVHENTSRFGSIFGTVAMVDNGIINYCHHELNLIVHDRQGKTGDPIEGALVIETKPGVHEWVGSVDINSLYPSTIRSINISPEKLIGQFTCDEQDWRGIRAKDNKRHTMKLEWTDDLVTKTGEEWYNFFVENKWCISGYGTVFDQSEGPGIIPLLLAKWYSERKLLQAEKKKWGAEAKKLKKELGFELTEEELALL